MKNNLVGQKFGRLTVIKDSNKRTSSGAIIWECQCECGNITYVNKSKLTSGNTKSCGCLRKELYKAKKPHLIKDISNQKFGKLTALYTDGNSKNHSIIWVCECECGNKCQVTSRDLISGNTKSCGCMRNQSYGEQAIKDILISNHIDFIQEYRPPKEELTFAGRFDFFIPSLNLMIEYDGIQHFKQGSGKYDYLEKFNLTKQHDEIKNIWCKEHNIQLIRIPYTISPENITLDIILGKGEKKNDFQYELS